MRLEFLRLKRHGNPEWHVLQIIRVMGEPERRETIALGLPRIRYKGSRRRCEGTFRPIFRPSACAGRD